MLSRRDVVVMNQPANSHNDGNGQEEQIKVAGKQQMDLEETEMSKIYNLSDENVARMDEGITDVTGKSELVEHEEKESVDEVRWIFRRISEFLLRLIYSGIKYYARMISRTQNL